MAAEFTEASAFAVPDNYFDSDDQDDRSAKSRVQSIERVELGPKKGRSRGRSSKDAEVSCR